MLCGVFVHGLVRRGGGDGTVRQQSYKFGDVIDDLRLAPSIFTSLHRFIYRFNFSKFHKSAVYNSILNLRILIRGVDVGDSATATTRHSNLFCRQFSYTLLNYGPIVPLRLTSSSSVVRGREVASVLCVLNCCARHRMVGKVPCLVPALILPNEGREMDARKRVPSQFNLSRDSGM